MAMNIVFSSNAIRVVPYSGLDRFLDAIGFDREITPAPA
jgi:hypothetical protein